MESPINGPKNTLIQSYEMKSIKDALLQKTYTTDYLEHRVEKNRGHLPQYYVENSHPAIIDKEEWEIVQAELMRRDDRCCLFWKQHIQFKTNLW